jgi:hypothetical protein
LSSPSRPDWHILPPIQCASGNVSPVRNRPQREADHSSRSSVDVPWSVTTTPPIRLRDVLVSQENAGRRNIRVNTSVIRAWTALKSHRVTRRRILCCREPLVFRILLLLLLLLLSLLLGLEL